MSGCLKIGCLILIALVVTSGCDTNWITVEDPAKLKAWTPHDPDLPVPNIFIEWVESQYQRTPDGRRFVDLVYAGNATPYATVKFILREMPNAGWREMQVLRGPIRSDIYYVKDAGLDQSAEDCQVTVWPEGKQTCIKIQIKPKK